MQFLFLPIILAILITLFCMMRRSQQELEQAQTALFQENNLEAYDKIANGMLIRVMQPGIVRYKLLLQKYWYYGQVDLMLKGLVKAEKIYISQRQAYILPCFWFLYDTMAGDYKQAAAHYDQLVRLCDRESKQSLKELVVFFDLVLKFHTQHDFLDYDQMKQAISTQKQDLFNCWCYYELCYVDLKMENTEAYAVHSALCRNNAGQSFFLEKINLLDSEGGLQVGQKGKKTCDSDPVSISTAE